MDKNLDEMIKNYSDELMRFARQNNIESLAIKSEAQNEEKSISEKEREETEKTENEEQAADTLEKPQEISSQKEASEIPSEDEMENYATIKARVFTGFSAFPVEKAKVVLYKNDILHAFLVTDKSGETQTIKIEAYPEKNSLEPLSDEQRLDYSADIYADGFNPQKNLLVSAVGGSEIVLNSELTPESEGIS